VVVSDNDGPGIEGAKVLFEKIPIPKTMFIPPGKDLRAFVRDGGTKQLIDSMLKNYQQNGGGRQRSRKQTFGHWRWPSAIMRCARMGDPDE
jgi:hypothetical protein